LHKQLNKEVFVIDKNSPSEKLSDFFAETVNSILKYEEYSSESRPLDVSYKEMHVIETVAGAIKDGIPARATEIAASLRVAPGTFTSAADVLEKKDYLVRTRDENDRRGVRVTLTEKGILANAMHKDFHNKLASELTESISNEDSQILLKAVEILQSFYGKKDAASKGAKVKIYADSSCDISLEDAAAMGVTLVPMSINFGDTIYRQNIDITAGEFFKKLEESNIVPTTSQLTPFDLEKVYKEATEDGSEVVAIHLSSALSGTYQSAALAAREVPGVYPVDSQSATLGMATLVRAAAVLRNEGESAQTIAKKVTELSDRVLLLAYIPTLKYLVRGGRVSSAAGLVGSILNVYPIVSVRDGVVKNIGKARGKNMAQREIGKIIDAHGIDKKHGVFFAHASAPADMEALKTTLKDQISGCEIINCEVGAVIGTHTGPGAVAVAFITKESHAPQAQ
jgi:DegV family protein with EDD domain